VRNYEDEDWTTKIVKSLEELGQEYYLGYVGGDVSFISKYPLENGKELFNNEHRGTVASFDLNINGRIISITGVHLDYTYYACYLPRGYNGGYPNWGIIADGNGKPAPITNVDTVQAYNLKSTRDEAIVSFLESASEKTVPTILMGDFNEPSHLDWTEKTKDMFDHNGLIMPWYNTDQLENHGFIDAFREQYPDEVANPGFTWPSFAHEKESTSWTPLVDERDRIDYIFYKGSELSLVDVALVGPKESYIFNQSESLNVENEKFLASGLSWPSDHKAVLAKFKFEE
jgi:hypothetical protein